MDLNTRQRLRQAYLELGTSMGVRHFLTLQTNQNWSDDRMKKLIRELAGRMDRKGLGHFFHTQSIQMRMNGLFFIEGDTQGESVHAHGLVTWPYGDDEYYERATRLIWSDICPSGSVDLQPIRDDGAASYASKLAETRNYNTDRIVMLAELMSEKSRSILTN